MKTESLDQRIFTAKVILRKEREVMEDDRARKVERWVIQIKWGYKRHFTMRFGGNFKS